MKELTHFDKDGQARMVDVSTKSDTVREAVAKGVIHMKPETFRMIQDKEISKGDVLNVARVAGIMAAKKTPDLIPMCHPIEITGVDIKFHPSQERNCIEIESSVRTVGKTGVEMDALMSVSVAALTIYDMCKSIDKDMTITDIYLKKKSGGKSGTYIRNQESEVRSQKSE
ncbi:MAG: cyclic pyranopterin monophosphate synthase MoaC [Nitrospinae bacterium]|nr:cyclic pyranopterin monophosphate synthase MoaC [Nitrospinota bacterium]